MITAIYLRVSSKQQDTASQEPDLDRWAKAHDTTTKIYCDKFSGRTMDRPGWNKLWADVQRGLVGRIVVWRLDRLGRTASGLTKLFDELQRHKVDLVSIKDGLDLGTAAGRLMANVLASVAQFETEVRGERILAGQATAKAKGKKWGGSKKGRRLSISQETETLIKRLITEGMPISTIARTVKVSRPTVYRFVS